MREGIVRVSACCASCSTPEFCFRVAFHVPAAYTLQGAVKQIQWGAQVDQLPQVLCWTGDGYAPPAGTLEPSRGCTLEGVVRVAARRAGCFAPELLLG